MFPFEFNFSGIKLYSQVIHKVKTVFDHAILHLIAKYCLTQTRKLLDVNAIFFFIFQP